MNTFKTLLLLFLLNVSFVSSAAARMQTDREQAKLRGPVHTVISMSCKEDRPPSPFLEEYRWMTTYDRQGMEINRGENWVWERAYDSENRLKKRTLVGVDGYVSQIEQFIYGSDGRLTVVVKKYSQQINNGSGLDKANTYTFIYDGKGRLVEESSHIPPFPTRSTRYTYYENGNKHEDLDFKPDGSLNMRTVYTYEETSNGKKVDRSMYDGQSKLLRGDLMEYDRYGNPTGYTRLKAPPPFKPGFDGLYVYEYDIEGNWIKRSHYPDLPPHEEPNTTTCRNISYYQEVPDE